MLLVLIVYVRVECDNVKKKKKTSPKSGIFSECLTPYYGKLCALLKDLTVWTQDLVTVQLNYELFVGEKLLMF